jgi:hypothetical protein
VIYIVFRASYITIDYKWKFLWQIAKSMHEFCEYLVSIKCGCITVRLLSIPGKKAYGKLQIGRNGEVRYTWSTGSARVDRESL